MLASSEPDQSRIRIRSGIESRIMGINPQHTYYSTARRNSGKYLSLQVLQQITSFWFDLRDQVPIIDGMYNTLLLKPRTTDRFENLMDLYERNYILMRLLAPELRSMDEGCFVSEAGNTPALELRDISHSKYTSTFKLTYHFTSAPGGQKPYEPDLFVRLYHDARSCEVMSGLLPEGRFEERRTRDLGQGQRLNQFLYRWLSYCLTQGHSFSEQPVSADRAELLQAYCSQCLS